MKHEHFVIRKAYETDPAHLFEVDKYKKPPTSGYWSDISSLCQMAAGCGVVTPPGDGTPVCVTCAKIAKEKGWLGK